MITTSSAGTCRPSRASGRSWNSTRTTAPPTSIVCNLIASGRSRPWAFEALGGEDAVLRLESIGIAIPLSEIYVFVSLLPQESEADAEPRAAPQT